MAPRKLRVPSGVAPSVSGREFDAMTSALSAFVMLFGKQMPIE